jgi:hypothetical protein
VTTGNKLLARPARPEACSGQKSVQPHRIKQVLFLGLCFGQTDDSLPVLELPSLAKKIDSLESLENTAFCFNSPLAFQTWMLTHDIKKGLIDCSLYYRIAIG